MITILKISVCDSIHVCLLLSRETLVVHLQFTGAIIGNLLVGGSTFYYTCCLSDTCICI